MRNFLNKFARKKAWHAMAVTTLELILAINFRVVIFDYSQLAFVELSLVLVRATVLHLNTNSLS